MRPSRHYAIPVALTLAFAMPMATVRTSQRTHVRDVDVLHYTFDLTVDEKNNTVGGTVVVRCVPLESISLLHFDAAEMNVRRVTLQQTTSGSLDLPYTAKDGTLTIRLTTPKTGQDTLDVAIAYSCRPRTGMYFMHPDKFSPLEPVQMWTQGEEEQNHFWFPCYDHPDNKATVRMRVTVNEKFVAISNGALIEETADPARHTRTFTWYSAKPFSSYLISLIVGRYEKLEQWYKNIPVDFYVYPSQTQEAMRSFSKTVDMIGFYSSKIGFDYPWQKYAQTVVSRFTYGGMENVSATTLTDRTIHNARAEDDYSSEGLVAHELAHQWFGDLLTCRTWTHAWLNEGFATYFASLYLEHDKGWDAFQNDILEKQQTLILSDTGSARRPTVTRFYDEPSDVFDLHIYARGACILNMLRFILGDYLFWQGMQHYVDLHQYGNVTTTDFQSALEDVAGQRLDWFFDEWATKAGYPEYDVSASFDAPLKLVHLTVRQTQKVDTLTPLYRMPVAVEIATASGKHSERLMVGASAEQQFDLPVDGPPLNIVFDKGNWILKKLVFKKPVQELLYELRHGDVVERIRALQGLTPSLGLPGIRGSVDSVLGGDSFWAVRRTAASVLSEAHDPAVAGELISALKDSDSRVRVAAAAGLSHFREKDVVRVLQQLVKEDSSYSVIAQAITSLVAVDTGHAMKYCGEALSMNSFNDSIRVAAIKAMGSLKTKDVRERLVRLTGYGHPANVRAAAISALADNWPADTSVRKLLEGLVGDHRHYIRRTALEALGRIARPQSRPVLQHVLATEVDELLRRAARGSLRAVDRATP